MKSKPVVMEHFSTVHTSFVVDFTFTNNITILMGDSGTGKTATFSFIRECMAVNPQILCLDNYDYQKDIKEIIRQTEGKLVVIDNADILLDDDTRKHISLDLVADSMDDAVDVVNEIAPEHLEIQTINPFETMTQVRNAGAIFMGEYSSEPLGDYFAGPNHVLPTNGTAKFFSPLGVDAYVKKSSIIYYSKKALKPVSRDIIQFAESEYLTAHANSIRVRFEDDKE